MQVLNFYFVIVVRRCKGKSVRSHATGVSQGPRPVLSRFAAAHTAVACREFVGERWLPPAIAVVEISRVPRLSTEAVMICYSGS
jgi:hypothetical protein